MKLRAPRDRDFRCFESRDQAIEQFKAICSVLRSSGRFHPQPPNEGSVGMSVARRSGSILAMQKPHARTNAKNAFD
jgi:hypothetical protein